MEPTPKPLFPMRINRYLALKKHSTRRGADELIEKKQVFINGRLAVLGDKVQETDVVEVKFRGKPTPQIYIAYNKPAGIAAGIIDEANEQSEFPKGTFPVGAPDRDAHGLVIFTNDGRITDRLLSPAYFHEKEYVVTTRKPLRSSFKEKMEAGLKIENEMTKPCKVKILDADKFQVILTDEKRHQVRRMCVTLFQEVKDMQCVRIMTVVLGSLKEGHQRQIRGDELKAFLESLKL